MRCTARRALAWQVPLHRLRPAGIGAASDDAEIGARLLQRLRVDVGLGGRLLDGGHRLGATGKLVLYAVRNIQIDSGYIQRGVEDASTSNRKSRPSRRLCSPRLAS